jgi:hypothetical protein
MRFGTDATERMRLDSSGRLLVSTTSSTSNIAGYGNGGIQLNSTTTAQACVNIIHRNNSNNTHAIVLAKARDGAANGGRVQNDDDFGAISFQGFDGTGGTNYRQGAEIRGAVDGTPGNNDMPGRLEFLTNSGSSLTERLRINSLGTFDFTNGALIEEVQVTSGKLSANQNINLDNGMVYLFTTQETTTSTPNIRINSSNTLDAAMSNGKVISLTIMTTAAAAGYFTTVTIDGNANGQNSYTLNVDWLGGSAPSEGGSSGIDVYNITIIKQSSKNFNILIAKNNYA